MTKQREVIAAISGVLLGLYGPTLETALPQHTVSFSTADPGQTKSVAEWGVDTAWPSFDNVRQSVHHLGAGNVDVVRLTFHPAHPLTANGDGTYELSATAKGFIDNQLGLAAMAGNKPLTLMPGEFGPTFDATHWLRTIKATQRYINSRPAWTNTPIRSIEVFNEPDFWAGQGSPTDLNNLIAQLKNDPVFQNTAFPAGSTLNSNNARGWYDPVPQATQGSSHLLGGSMTNYVNFMEYVKGQGKQFVNPELHSLGEAIIGAEHGMAGGIFWGDALRARGLFVRASDGKRLGYHEDLGRQSAAAVYRAPDGKTYAFAGGLERFGGATSYRFVAADRDVYFNGIPVREYALHTKFDETNAANPAGDDFQNYGSWSNQGAYADVETGAGLAPLDGYRWKIVNASGQVMEVANSGTSDGAAIRSAVDANALNQKWDIVRTRNGYVHLFNANSGRTAEVASGSLNNGASVRQWGTADNAIQQWYIEDAGNGTFYIRNAHSNKYLTTSTVNSTQNDNTQVLNNAQRWRFVLSNPNLPAKAHYAFQGNVNDNAGANHATVQGVPTYAAGPNGSGQAINLNGATDYVQLPAGVVSSKDISVSAYVKWDGGNAWQRVFDFGNNTSSYMFLTPRSGDNTMRFAITTGSGEQRLDTSPLPVGQWVHLTLTLGGNTGVLYVDGKPRVAGQILLDPAHLNSTLNYIGKSQFNDPLFDGMIDEFRIFDYALDPGQVASFVFQRWTGEAGANWTAAAQASPKNWQSKLTATDHDNGTAVLFDDYATSFSVNIADATVTPASTQFDNRNNNYVLNGPGAIAGGGALTKNGAGALTINNANTYTGGTLLNNGTLNLNDASAIGTGTLTIATGATINNTSGAAVTLAPNNAQVWNGDFTFGGSNALNMGSGAVTLTGNRTVTTNGVAPLTVGAIGEAGGARSFTKAGPGTLILSGDNAYTGSTNVTAGTLAIAGTLATSPTTNVYRGTLAVSGTHTAGGDVWIGLNHGGDGNVSVQPGGTLTANVLLIGAGGSPTALASGSGTLASGGTINTNRWFVLGHSGAAGTTGSFAVNGGTLNVHTSAAASGNLEIGTFDAANATLDINPGSNVRLLNNAALVFGAQGNHAGDGVVNHNGGDVTFYSDGGTTVGGGGRLVMASAANPGGSYTYNLNGGTLTVPRVARENTDNNPAAVFNFNGGTLKATKNQAAFLGGLTRANVRNGAATIDTGGFNVTVAQPLLHSNVPGDNATDGGLTKTGAGVLVLAGANTYTGPTVANAGTLVLGESLTTSSSVTALNDATIELANDGSHKQVIKTGEIAVASNARVDLKDNKLLTATSAGNFDGTAYTGVQGMVQRAYNFGAWDQPGLTTSEQNAGQDAGPLSNTTTIGVATAEQVLFIAPSETGVFAGQTVSGSTVIAMYTYAGDLNFDGLVDGADYGTIDNYVQFPGTDGYVNGDVNYDGVIDGADYGIIDNTIQLQGPPLPGRDSTGHVSPAGTVAVPEPAPLTAIALAALTWTARRRRRGHTLRPRCEPRRLGEYGMLELATAADAAAVWSSMQLGPRWPHARLV